MHPKILKNLLKSNPLLVIAKDIWGNNPMINFTKNPMMKTTLRIPELTIVTNKHS